MSNQVCLLCLQVFDKFPQKIRLENLHKLVTICHHNYYQSFHESDLDGDEVCDFCPDCYPLFSTVEEIRTQISFLEEQVGTKIKQIQKIIGEGSSSQLKNKGIAKIVLIRDMIFHATGGDDEEQLGENFALDAGVKVEHDEIDPLGDVSDQFLDDHYNSETGLEKEEEEDSIQDEDEAETAFCIFPDPQTELTIHKENKPKCYTKRKREHSSPLPIIITKQRKMQPDREPTPEASVPRFSPRIKKQTSQSLVSSPKKMCPINPIPKSERSDEDDDDTKSAPDSDWAPNIKDLDSIAPSDATLPSYKCITCSKSFKRKRTLLSHRHTPRCRRISCIAPLCTATFHSERARDAHLRASHKGLTPYQCRICENKFSHSNKLAAHMVMRHEKGEKKLTCVKCGKKFCLEENLARHLRLHDLEGSKPLVCEVCDRRFEDEERLQKHFITHKKRFQCTQCSHRFKCRKDLEIHMKTHGTEKTEKCPHCDYSAHLKYSLRDHIARVHPVGPATHICHICGKGFYLPADLKMHLDRHDGKFGRKCDICGESFSTQIGLQGHLVKVHGKDPIVCDECGATFASLGGFQRHMKVHAGEKNHKCETCGACFINAGGLRSHIRTHTGERPFPCPHCDKAFKTGSYLIKHVKVIHTPGYVAPTPHKCPHCDKGCSTPFFLRCHIRQAHTGERPFSCDQCGKGFAVKSALTLHLKTAHGVVPEKTDRLPRSKKDAFHDVQEDND